MPSPAVRGEMSFVVDPEIVGVTIVHTSDQLTDIGVIVVLHRHSRAVRCDHTAEPVYFEGARNRRDLGGI